VHDAGWLDRMLYKEKMDHCYEYLCNKPQAATSMLVAMMRNHRGVSERVADSLPVLGTEGFIQIVS
jgi:hypothetical protein